MCGIVGAIKFSSNAFKIDEEYIVKMRDTMITRGPDGEGVWLSNDNSIGFGFRRLSIIDLSEKANQPMLNPEQTISIVFNGEIYNHAEIRIELERLNKYTWVTDHSDTEVILHAYEEWGINCIHKFRGMFAIAIWDEIKQKLFLIRDRVGVKPLYYSIHDDRLVFASEIKAILEDPDQKRRINEDGFFHYLSFLVVPAPNTLYEGIMKIPPATYLEFNKDGSKIEVKYWDSLDFKENNNYLNESELSQNILDKLKESVKLRKVSDVPVGVFLSGGIDSSTNAALCKDNDSVLKTFSIGYDQEYKSYKSELHFANKMANKIGAEYHEKRLSIDDLINFLPEMIKIQDEPIADSVCVPLYYVSKLAKENGVVVCQVGEGADELFFGYPNWQRILRLQKFSNFIFLKPFIFIAFHFLKIIGLTKDWRYEFLKRSTSSLPLFWGGAEFFNHNQKLDLLSERMKKKYKSSTSWEIIEPIYNKFLNKSKYKDTYAWMTYIDLNFRLPELLLMRVDKMTMANSIEARVPFLDHKFIEFIMSIPSNIKYKFNDLKYILKKSVKGIIPDEIINRKKQGFAAPIEDWFSEGLGNYSTSIIKEFCIETDLINYAEVEKLLNSNRKSYVWPILNAALWWKFYIKKQNI